MTALHEASQRADAEAVKLLLHHNADVNAKNQEGETPIHGACINRFSFIDTFINSFSKSSL